MSGPAVVSFLGISRFRVRIFGLLYRLAVDGSHEVACVVIVKVHSGLSSDDGWSPLGAGSWHWYHAGGAG